ncbi:NET1-associated nuclear protein 1 [Exophiala xenobiotica]|uniref:NET1-associated nuclear protein 1 n=1 Tax=Lithohypha guttulata TaxID=1690604 RepID=A0ABR0K3X7_9EURO|nr:NET1-associated nuclear protein 1 [Lithohypha guttulata]KAK5312488.1 NET1-associated nuclear protein 1 [Exophiala xenobiotica]
MSQSTKRDAQQAFGKDVTPTQSSSPSKKSRRRRGKDSLQLAPVAVEAGTGTPIEAATALLQEARQSSVKSEHASPKKQSVKKSRKTQQEDRPSSPTVKRERKEPSEQSEDPANGQKKKSRSKRHSKPQFDRNNPQVELVLSRTKDIPNSPNGDEAQRGESKRRQKKEHRREGRGLLEAERQSKKKHKQKSLTRQSRSTSDWTLTPPSGGAFIDHDPVLTPDEQFLILATKQDIHIYATKTSLLLRTLHVAKTSEITTYAQIQPQEQFIAVGLKDGTLLKYDWTTGRRVWALDFNGSITAITSTSSSVEADGFLMINESDDGSYNMTSLALDATGRQVGRRHLLSQKTLIKPQVCFAADLGIVTVCSKDTILVGQLGSDDGEDAAPLLWKEVSVNGKIVCFHAQILPASKQAKKGSNQPIVNVAVGLRSGEIYLYNDLLNNANTGNDLHIRRLHWHRAAPRTVKFSPDSNYLISGGDETVLVIWQLDTNQKQVLPHLTTPILNATISHQGSAYALRLADNSVMVLSTSDLQPFANISSLAFDASSRAPYLPALSTPAVLHPSHSDRLLLAYSLQNSSPSIKPSEKSTNMLQTYDIASHLQLSRQALARNLVSTVSIGPNGQPLKEPDVTHLDITHDGQWLVTVDQWSPSDTDTRELYLSRGDQSRRAQLNECFLRFWSTSNMSSDTGTDNWELNTRIDEPISTSLTATSPTKQAILAVAIGPARHQVAVADSTRSLKLYSPKARIRSGVPVRDAQGQQLFTWTYDHIIPLSDATVSPDPNSATLAFSEDGSVLAASWTTNSHLKARVHLIDSKNATVAASLPDIVGSGTATLAWCGRYLLSLSERFVIYDTVSMTPTFVIEIDDRFSLGKSRMAVNSRSGVVAVCVSERDMRTPSRLILFDVNDLGKKPVLEEQVHGQIHVLLAERDRGGFLIIDGEGRTSSVSPPGPAGVVGAAREDIPEKAIVRSSLQNVFGTGTGRKEETALDIKPKVVDGPQRANLEKVFRFESTARAPGASELFRQVALVVSGAAA